MDHCDDEKGRDTFVYSMDYIKAVFLLKVLFGSDDVLVRNLWRRIRREEQLESILRIPLCIRIRSKMLWDQGTPNMK